MKKIFLTCLLALPLFVFAQRKLEPTVNAFEAKILERITNENDEPRKAQILADALRDERAGAALFFNAANMRAQNSDLENARELYQKAVKILPTFYLAYKNLAYLYYNANMHEQALESFGAAIALSAEDSKKTYSAYGFSLFELKRFDEALTAFETALMYDPKNENLLRAKARALYETGQHERLYKFAETLVRLHPKEPVYWRMLARIDANKEFFQSAAASLEAMRKLGIADQSDLELLGDVYLRLALYEKAAEIYAGLKISERKTYEAAKYLAHNNAVQPALRLASALDKNSAEYLEILAITENTKDAFEKAYAKNPANAYLAIRLGDFYLSEKRFESAKIFYRQGAKDFKYQSLLGLARTHIEEGDYDSAADCMEQISTQFNRDDLKSYIEKLREHAKQK